MHTGNTKSGCVFPWRAFFVLGRLLEGVPMTEQPAIWKQILACVSFCIFNIGLCEFNSWALQKDRWPGFHFTWFYTMFHMLVSAIAAFLLQWLVTKPAMGGPTFQQAWEYRLLIIPMGLCSYLMNGLNNASLALVTLFLNQAIKVTLPFFTMSFSFLFANKTYSALMIFVVFGLCVGSVLSVWHKMSGEGGSSSIMGVVMCIIGMMAGAIKGVLVMILCAGVGPMADKPKLEPTVVLVYDCSIAFVLMLITWACLDEREESTAYLSDPDTRTIGLIIIAIGSSMAFCFNLSMFYFTMRANRTPLLARARVPLPSKPPLSGALSVPAVPSVASSHTHLPLCFPARRSHNCTDCHGRIQRCQGAAHRGLSGAGGRERSGQLVRRGDGRRHALRLLVPHPARQA
jgi:drug/metabolite transporter (DMT)-like permease